MISDLLFGPPKSAKILSPHRSAVAWLQDMGGYMTSSAAGEPINEASVMTVAAWYNAVNMIAGPIAMMPLDLFEREGDNKKSKAKDHPVSKFAKSGVNDRATNFTFWETMLQYALNWGNGFAIIEKDNEEPANLVPIHPTYIQIINRDDGLVYVIDLPEQDPMALPAGDVFHLRGLGNGLSGYSPLDLARQSLGISIGQDKYVGRFFANNARPGGIIECDFTHKDQEDQIRRWKERWQEAQSGANQHSVAVLFKGMSWKPTTIEPEKAQLLESRQFQVSEIARWMNIPPHLIKDLSRATFSNIEQQNIEFLQYTLEPWMVRIEQECNRKLLTERDRERYYFELNPDIILRTDFKTRVDAYKVQIESGQVTLDEVRAMENRNPYPDGIGEKPLIAANNMKSLESVVNEEDEPDEEAMQPPMLPGQPPPALPAPDEEDQDQARREVAKKAITRPLMDTCARLCKKTANAAKRAHRGGKALSEKERDVWIEALTPYAESLVELVGGTLDSATVKYVNKCVGDVTQTLFQDVSAQVDDAELSTIEDWLVEWSGSTPGAVAVTLTEAVCRDGKATD